MEPRIETLREKRLIGNHMRMSLANNRTGELWRSFMPRRREIQNHLNAEMISMQVHDKPVNPGDLNQEFEKWAVVEVADFNTVPEGMETFVLEGGLYAV